jgi:hypothetical protein
METTTTKPVKAVADETHANALAALISLFDISYVHAENDSWISRNINIYLSCNTNSISNEISLEVKRLAKPFFIEAFKKHLKEIQPSSDDEQWNGAISIENTTGALRLKVEVGYSYENQTDSTATLSIGPDSAAFDFILEKKIKEFSFDYSGSGDDGCLNSYSATHLDGNEVDDNITHELMNLLEEDIYNAADADFNNEGSSGSGEGNCNLNEEGEMEIEISHSNNYTDSDDFQTYYDLETVA